MMINGVRCPDGPALPAAGAALSGATVRGPSVGHGGAQHTALSVRAAGEAGEASGLRVGVGKLSLNVGQALDGVKVRTAAGPHQVPKGAVLQGAYSAESLARAMGAVVNGLAGLKRDFPEMA